MRRSRHNRNRRACKDAVSWCSEATCPPAIRCASRPRYGGQRLSCLFLSSRLPSSNLSFFNDYTILDDQTKAIFSPGSGALRSRFRSRPDRGAIRPRKINIETRHRCVFFLQWLPALRAEKPADLSRPCFRESRSCRSRAAPHAGPGSADRRCRGRQRGAPAARPPRSIPQLRSL